MIHKTTRLTGVALFCLSATACEIEIGSAQQELGIEGRWHAPEHILADGDLQMVDYTGAGPWIDEETSCGGGFSEGGEALRSYLAEHFQQSYHIGGYSCRPIVGNSAQTSVHATGRALDIMIRRTAEGDADNDLGDPLAHWLIQNAEEIGIQFIIWDLTTWMAARPEGDKERAYGGQHPHDDHLHIELSVEAGLAQTPWFAGVQAPPVLDACPPLPRNGGVIDDLDSCTQLLGNSEYWRIEEGQGYGDRLAWTDAHQADEQANWARWQIALSEAGEYELEVFGGSAFSVHQKARYELLHGGTSSELSVDQSQIEGWHSLGTFDFASGGGQQLAVFDNNFESVEDEQHITVDAIRLTRIDDDSGDGSDGSDGSDGQGEETGESGDVIGGCHVASTDRSSLPSLLLLLFGLVAWRRRR